MTQPCIKEKEIGKLEEFMENTKGMKATMFTISVAILIQVGAFLVLWGGLTTTVKYHEKSINSILEKLDKVKIICAMGESGLQDIQGEKGDKGDKGDK